MTKINEKKLILEYLRETPIVQLACEKAGVSRATYYRWRKGSKKFRQESDQALQEGQSAINDLAESQLIKAIERGDLAAIRFWLPSKHNHYKKKTGSDILEGGHSHHHHITHIYTREEVWVRLSLRLLPTESLLVVSTVLTLLAV